MIVVVDSNCPISPETSPENLMRDLRPLRFMIAVLLRLSVWAEKR